MVTKDQEKEYQENIMKIRYIESQIPNLQQQMSNLDRALIELATTRNALNIMRKQDKDDESLLPLGSGVFVEGVLKKQKRVLADVGAGAIVEKNIPEVLEILNIRENNIKQNMVNIQNMVNNLEQQYVEAGKTVKEITEEVQEKGNKE